MTEGNLRQSASKGRGDNLVSSMCFCVCLSPLPATPALFTKTIELGVESVQLENSRKIQILKHKTTSYSVSDAFPPSSLQQGLG